MNILKAVLKARLLPSTLKRRALQGIINRAGLGRVASVVHRYGRGPRALSALRSQLRGIPREAVRYILNFAHQGVQAPRLQTRARLFLKEIPIARGLFGREPAGRRVRYGVAVTWLDTDTGQSETMFMHQDYERPQLTAQLEQEAADRAKKNIRDSPGAFGVPGTSNIEIVGVEQIYVFRSF